MKNVDLFIKALKSMDKTMRSDIKAGKVWVYSNGSIPKAKNFDQARRTGKLALNCVDGVHWGLIKSGVIGKTREAIQWYGGDGFIRWYNDEAEANARKYLKIITVPANRTIEKCIQKGLLKAGDICIYHGMTHTNVYLGDHKSFDSGHAYCTGSGDGAVFKKWIGQTPYTGNNLAFILRLWEVTYRVQVGAYSLRSKADAVKAQLAEHHLDSFTEKESDGLIHLFCGSFDDIQKAEARAEMLRELGFKKTYAKQYKI